MTATAPNPAWVKQIRQEYQRLLDDENVIHNRELHQRILTAWRLESPQMWANLSRAGLTTPLAYVLQERMWTEMDDLQRQGVPVTDAREQAERNHLMLEPEAQDEDSETEAQA